jgi:hypothetical protein
VFSRTLPKNRSPAKEWRDKTPDKKEEPVMRRAEVAFENKTNTQVNEMNATNSMSVEQLDDIFNEFNNKVNTEKN